MNAELMQPTTLIIHTLGVQPRPPLKYMALYLSDLAALETIQYTGISGLSETRLDRLIDLDLVVATGLHWCQAARQHQHQFGLTRRGRIVRRYMLNLARPQRLRAGRRVECYDVEQVVSMGETDFAVWLSPALEMRSGVLLRLEGERHRVAVVLLDGDQHETRWPVTKVREQ